MFETWRVFSPTLIEVPGVDKVSYIWKAWGCYSNFIGKWENSGTPRLQAKIKPNQPSIIAFGSHFYSHLFDSLKDLVILLAFICQGWIGWLATHLLKKQIKIVSDLKRRRISVSLGTVKDYSHMLQFYWFAIGYNSYDVNTNLNIFTQLLLVLAAIWRVNVVINQVLFCILFSVAWPTCWWDIKCIYPGSKKYSWTTTLSKA